MKLNKCLGCFIMKHLEATGISMPDACAISVFYAPPVSKLNMFLFRTQQFFSVQNLILSCKKSMLRIFSKIILVNETSRNIQP